MSEDEGIDGSVELLFKEIARGEGVFAVGVSELIVKLVECIYELILGEVVDDVFYSVN